MSSFDPMDLEHPRATSDTEEDQARAAIASALASHTLHPDHAVAQHLADQTNDGDITMDSGAHEDEDDYDQSAFMPDLSTVTGGADVTGIEGMHSAGLLDHDQEGHHEGHDASPGGHSMGGTPMATGGGVVRGIGGMSEDEIRRKQNRSRAGGRVLPVSRLFSQATLKTLAEQVSHSSVELRAVSISTFSQPIINTDVPPYYSSQNSANVGNYDATPPNRNVIIAPRYVRTRRCDDGKIRPLTLLCWNEQTNRECVYSQRKQKSRVKLLEDKLGAWSALGSCSSLFAK